MLAWVGLEANSSIWAKCLPRLARLRPLWGLSCPTLDFSCPSDGFLGMVFEGPPFFKPPCLAIVKGCLLWRTKVLLLVLYSSWNLVEWVVIHPQEAHHAWGLLLTNRTVSPRAGGFPNFPCEYSDPPPPEPPGLGFWEFLTRRRQLLPCQYDLGYEVQDTNEGHDRAFHSSNKWYLQKLHAHPWPSKCYSQHEPRRNQELG